MLYLSGYLEDLTVQFDKSMFFVGNEHRGSLSYGSWLSILGKKKGVLSLLEVLMISCDIRDTKSKNLPDSKTFVAKTFLIKRIIPANFQIRDKCA